MKEMNVRDIKPNLFNRIFGGKTERHDKSGYDLYQSLEYRLKSGFNPSIHIEMYDKIVR